VINRTTYDPQNILNKTNHANTVYHPNRGDNWRNKPFFKKTEPVELSHFTFPKEKNILEIPAITKVETIHEVWISKSNSEAISIHRKDKKSHSKRRRIKGSLLR